MSIHRPRAHAWVARDLEALGVRLHRDRGRTVALPSQTVQSIPAILAGYEPDLTPGSITVMDRRGNKYLDPGDPALGDNSRNRAREEEISEEILEKLDWIKGVRVAVQVIAPRVTTANAIGPAAGRQRLRRPVALSGSDAGRQRCLGHDSSRRRSDRSSTISVNEPLELEPESRARRSGTATGPCLALDRRDTRGEHRDRRLACTLGRDAGHERGRVLIYVPAQFLLQRGHQDRRSRAVPRRSARDGRTDREADPDGRGAGHSGCRVMESGRRHDSRTRCRSIRPLVLPSPTDPRRRFLDWGIVGVAWSSGLDPGRRRVVDPGRASPGAAA